MVAVLKPTARSAAHDLSDTALGGRIQIQNGQFKDGYGRTLSLRGLNVSGASKLPSKPNGLTHLTEGFYEHRTVTFTGRPFPLEDAPLHFRRLRAWGLPLIRLLVTWESIGHSGPNPNTDLDLDYISYLRQLIELMPKYGIKCFICAHQDVWSRFSGGSGAPGWTFEAAGLDIQAFTNTGAAYIHGQDEKRKCNSLTNDKEPRGPFVWPSGYQKLAASTMATLFWAGDALAPKLRCRRLRHGVEEEVSVQSFLQDAFLDAFGALADEVGNLEACIGFEPVNEPHRGLVNLHDFHNWNYATDLHIGHHPTLAESFALGAGYSQTVDYYVKSWPHPTRRSHRSLVDPGDRTAWLLNDGEDVVDRPRGMGKCVWLAHGVWAWDEERRIAVIFDADYFDYDHRVGREGTKIEWYCDSYAPFLRRFSERVTRTCSLSFSFIEPIPNEFLPPWPPKDVQTERSGCKETDPSDNSISKASAKTLVYAPHFYDLNVLFSKSYTCMSVNVQGLARKLPVYKALYFGAAGLRQNYKTQIGNIVEHGQVSLQREAPVLIGEVGIPFDINGATAFKTGDYDKQQSLMSALIGAMEDNLVGFTLWNYNPDNRIEYGDGWNKEDFSVINGDEFVPLHSVPDYRNKAHASNELYRGGRTLDVIIRPYAVKIAGQPIRSNWDSSTLHFSFEWESDSTWANKLEPVATEIFLPSYHYDPRHTDFTFELSDGTAVFDPAKQTVYLWHKHHDEDVVRHRFVVSLRDVRKHRVRNIMRRREALPPIALFNLMPPIAEVWVSELGYFRIVGLLVVLVTIFLYRIY